MAAIISSQTAFSANEQITSAKLNNILAQSSFDAGALTGDGTLTLVSGQMQVGTLKAANFPASIINQTMIATNVVGKGPAFRVYSNTTTSLPAAVFVQINLNVIQFDTNTNFNTSNNRFTPTIAGYYLISGQILSNAAPNGLIAAIYKKTDVYSYGSQINSSAQRAMVSDIVYLNGNDDYVYLAGYAQVATTINNSGSLDTYFSGCLIRSA